jgi:hypothetical protein
MRKRERRHLQWRWFYGAPDEPVAMAQEQPDGTWAVTIGGRAVGVFADKAATEEFINKVRRGADRARRG